MSFKAEYGEIEGVCEGNLHSTTLFTKTSKFELEFDEDREENVETGNGTGDSSSEDIDEEEFQRLKQELLERRKIDAQVWAEKMKMLESLSNSIDARFDETPAHPRHELWQGLNESVSVDKHKVKEITKWYEGNLIVFLLRNLALAFLYHLGVVSLQRILRLDDSEKNVDEESFTSPLKRFFKSGRRVLPLRRACLYLIGGSLTSTVVLLLTADPFIFGNPSVVSQFNFEDYSYYPVHLAFDNLGCKGGSLENVSGVIRPGVITAIMGPSGAGKSSLAQFLLGKSDVLCRSKFRTGSIYLNGKQRSLNSILDRVGFVPPEDVMYADLTVEESLMFSARWRLPRATKPEDYKMVLNKTLKALDLERVRHQRIGRLSRRGISGGEKKRVSIAYEMIAQPSVLVMDEPTSGLDSAAAYKLMKMLRNIARKGISVVIALHVPSNRIWNLIDDLILLQHGKEVYVGPRENVTAVFKSVGYDYYKSNNNEITLPEYLIDVLSGRTLHITYSNVKQHLGTVKASSQEDNEKNLSLADLWRANAGNSLMRTVENEIEMLRENQDLYYENKGIPYNFSTPETRNTRDWLGKCDLLKTSPARKTCILLRGFRFNILYPRLPKPGLLAQLLYWLDIVTKIRYRSGSMLFDFGSCILIAGVSGWVRSYCNAWEERVTSAITLSVGICCMGAFSPIFSDNVHPVRRAASSGMILGANNWAVITYTNISAFFQSIVFAFVFNFVLWVRKPSSRTLPSFWRYVEFSFLFYLYYLTSFALGFLLCVLGNHAFSKSTMFTIAFTMASHVFSRFNPNSRQIKLDSEIVIQSKKYSYRSLVEMICGVSPARYFTEAMFLWDNIPAEGIPDARRRFAMKYFDFCEENLNACLHMLFNIYCTLISIRVLAFAYINSTDFHTLYDTPNSAMFVLKVLTSFSLILFIGLCWHEWSYSAQKQEDKKKRE